MSKNAELIITDSYFKIFDILTDKLAGKTQSLSEKNVIFCEEKISLMAERALTEKFGGTLNTDVYSFSNYLKSRRKIDALSREGSAMAVKRILLDLSLSVIKAGKTNIAPTLFDLIIQLKSASVSSADLFDSLPFLPDGKREKIKDVATVYAAYEDFIYKNGFTDQSSVMDYLPEEIEKDENLKGARIILLGYNSLTVQARRAVRSLVKVAGEVIAVVSGGENGFLFVNEIADVIRNIFKSAGATVNETFVPSYDKDETALLVKTLFNPLTKKREPPVTRNILINRASNPESEAFAIAGTIAKGVKSGARYRDYTVALPDVKAYGKYLKYYFNLFNVPYFIDEKITPDTYPLVRLILSYFDVFRKNYERSAVVEFFKNPLFCDDKELTDFMENYFIRYNVNYDAVLKPFVFGEEDLEKAENFRMSLMPYFTRFDLGGMLFSLKVKEKNEALSNSLSNRGEAVAAEINAQVYDAVMKILADMDKILSGVEISYSERKNVFKSGVSAMQLSVIPQYYDAVYVGDYRKTALAKAKNLFAPSLVSGVPAVKEDVALLTDDDIELLKVKANIDPTVRIVNLREKENFGVALLAFSDKLYISYPEVDGGGKKTASSEVLKYFYKSFNLTPYSFNGRYVTEKESVLSFAEDCEAFSEKILAEIPQAAAFYAVSDNPVKDEILKAVKKELKIRLDGVKRDLFTETSPTKIESYHECPYKAFLTRILRLGESDDGEFSALSVGNLMHGIFKEYFANVSAVKDKESSDALFNACAGKILEKAEFKKFLADKESAELVKRVLTEAGNYCYKSACNLNGTSFKPDKLEYKVSYVLPETKVNLVGNVDRVDAFNDGEEKYVRIIDYKTGEVKSADDLLYAGVKLQLYLYAAAFTDGKTKISGLYYAPIKEEYSVTDDKNKYIVVGKTLNDEKSLAAQRSGGDLPAFADERITGKTEKVFSAEIINSCINYAVKICDLAVKRMREGVIVPSPYDTACEYCQFAAMCKKPFGDNTRKVAKTSCKTIAEIDLGKNDE